MRTLVEINVFLFLSTAAALFFIMRYRVHFHVEYMGRATRRKNPTRPLAKIPATVPDQLVKDLESALVNLGASEEESKTRAAAALAQGPGEFDALLLRALQSTERAPRIRHRHQSE